jgi:hypothetical protein
MSFADVLRVYAAEGDDLHNRCAEWARRVNDE